MTPRACSTRGCEKPVERRRSMCSACRKRLQREKRLDLRDAPLSAEQRLIDAAIALADASADDERAYGQAVADHLRAALALPRPPCPGCSRSGDRGGDNRADDVRKRTPNRTANDAVSHPEVTDHEEASH